MGIYVMHSIRLAPPLVISEEDLKRGVEIIRQSLEELDTVCSLYRHRSLLTLSVPQRDHIEDISAHDSGAHFVSL